MDSTPWSWKRWLKLVGYDALFLVVIAIVMTTASRQSTIGRMVWPIGLMVSSSLVGLFLSIGPRYFVMIDSRLIRAVLWISTILAYVGPLILFAHWIWLLKAGVYALALLLGGLVGFFWSQLDHALRTVRAGRVQSSRLA